MNQHFIVKVAFICLGNKTWFKIYGRLLCFRDKLNCKFT